MDLRAWLAVASRVIRYLAELAQDGTFISEADEDQRLFNDFSELNRLHWSPTVKRYCDYGLHSRNVKLETIVRPNQEALVGELKSFWIVKLILICYTRREHT